MVLADTMGLPIFLAITTTIPSLVRFAVGHSGRRLFSRCSLAIQVDGTGECDDRSLISELVHNCISPACIVDPEPVKVSFQFLDVPRGNRRMRFHSVRICNNDGRRYLW